MRKLHVLHIYKTYFPETYGGLEQAIRHLCLATKNYGVTNTVLTIAKQHTPQIIEYPECTVIRTPRLLEIASTPMSFSFLKVFHQEVKKADLIHYQFPWPFADLAHLVLAGNKPSIVTYQSDIVRQKFFKKLYRPVMKKFLNSVDKIVVTSPNYLKSSIDLQPFVNKCSITPLGLDEKNYDAPQKNIIEHWKQRLGTQFFLFIGVLRYYKGLPILLQAMENSPCHVVIAGTGPLEHALKEMAQKKNLKNVTFTGYIRPEDKVALLTLCKAIVFPSHLRSEAFGMVLLEGALFGKPLISTEIGTGTSYINIHEETGLVVPPEDPIALRDALSRLHFDDPLVQSLGRGARRRFELIFRSEIIGKQYRTFYEDILNKNEQRGLTSTGRYS